VARASLSPVLLDLVATGAKVIGGGSRYR
jgi:hypothetical protein